MELSFNNLKGQKYGHWTVIGDYIRDKKTYHKKFLCKCDCENGTEKYVDIQNIRSGKSISCGCVTKEVVRKRMTTHGDSHSTRLYNVWTSMRKRCDNPKDKRYSDYGGRGIKVCKEWEDYETFRNWAYLNGYDNNLEATECSIDRIDNSKGYSPDNCRWVGVDIQSNNKRNNIVIEYEGKKQTAAEWGRELGLDASIIRLRYHKGQFDELFNKKRINSVYIEYKGEIHTMAEWSRIKGINIQTISRRYNKGYPVEEIFRTDNLRKKEA